MENLPIGNFEVLFYDGIKIISSKSGTMYTVKIPKDAHSRFSGVRHDKSQESDGTWKFYLKIIAEEHIAPELSSIVKHAQDCERKIREIEQKAIMDKDNKYPMILKSHQSPTSSSLAVDKSNAENPGSRPHIASRPSSPPTSIHPSQATSFYAASPSEDGARSRIDRLASHQPSHMSRRTPFSARSGHASKPASSTNGPPQASNAAHTASRAKTASVAGSMFSVARSVSLPTSIRFLDGIGWCVQTNEKKFSMLFSDGIQVVVDPKTKALEFHEADGKTVDW